MTDVAKRRLVGLGALIIAGGSLAWITFGNLGENIVYYWSPTELLAQSHEVGDSMIRLGGVVVPGTFDPDECRPGCTFSISDGQNDVAISSTGMPPQMFREGIGVVVEGALHGDGVFHTDRIMIKHSNEYRAPDDPAVMPADHYNTLIVEGG